jgi:hypothetical protein
MKPSPTPGELVDKYRAVFLQSPMGLEVLGDILCICHFGTTLNPANMVQVSEYNVGATILANCGIFSPNTLGDVVKSLASVVPEKKEDRHEEV